jgi:aurora kinase A
MRSTTELTQEIEASVSSHDYVLLERIGEGAFGVVYKVDSRRYPGEAFVVKVMLHPTGSSAIIDDTEFQALLKLSHPNVLHLYAQWVSENCFYLVLEYAPNGSLLDLVRKNGPLNRTALRIWGRQILDALVYCHTRHFFHGDIKPGNILLDAHGRIKLADFGLAGRMTGEGKVPVKGSLPYMSPELLAGRSRDPFANDIWALGITFYQLLFRKLPWKSVDRRGITREIAGGVIALPSTLEVKLFTTLNTMLRDDPNIRPTAEQVLQMPAFTSGKEVKSGGMSSLAALGTATLSLTTGKIGISQRAKSQRQNNQAPQYDVCAYNPDADIDKLGLGSFSTEDSVNEPT